MMKTTQTLLSKNVVTVLTLAVVSISTSFAIGLKSSGSVQPFTLIEAGGNSLKGDINNDLLVDKKDIVLMLEMVAGYTKVTPEAYNADPNQDGRITIDDALNVLRELRF
jgi:hypothetical protein